MARRCIGEGRKELSQFQMQCLKMRRAFLYKDTYNLDILTEVIAPRESFLFIPNSISIHIPSKSTSDLRKSLKVDVIGHLPLHLDDLFTSALAGLSKSVLVLYRLFV